MSLNKLFVIRPMGDPGSEDREHSERIMEDYITPAAQEAGYEAYGDEEGHGPWITPEIYRGLEGDPMVIAYLGRPPWNPNVVFEVGYRLATRKPLVILKHEDEENDKPLFFDLLDIKYVNLPPYDQLKKKDGSRDKRIVQEIAEELHFRKSWSRLNSHYAVAEIQIDQRPGIREEEQKNIFTASSEAADRIFHVKDSLVGRNILDVNRSLFPRFEKCQVEPYQTEQEVLIGRLMMGQGRKPNDIGSKVPFIFKKSSDEDVDSPEYVDPKFRGHAFLAIVVQFRQLQNALFLYMLYFDVTGAVKWVGDHYVCL